MNKLMHSKRISSKYRDVLANKACEVLTGEIVIKSQDKRNDITEPERALIKKLPSSSLALMKEMLLDGMESKAIRNIILDIRKEEALRLSNSNITAMNN